MKAAKLKQGDAIGIVSPCTLPWNEIKDAFPIMEKMGFKVKLSENLFKNTYGYAASEKERADDFNRMVSVKTSK